MGACHCRKGKGKEAPLPGPGSRSGQAKPWVQNQGCTSSSRRYGDDRQAQAPPPGEPSLRKTTGGRASQGDAEGSNLQQYQAPKKALHFVELSLMNQTRTVRLL